MHPGQEEEGVSFALKEKVTQAKGIPAKKKAILGCLADHHNHNLADLVAWPSTKLQIDETGIPRSTLYRQRAEMERDGWIERLYAHPAAPAGVHEIWRLLPRNWRRFQNGTHSQNGKHSQSETSFSQNETDSQNGNCYIRSEPTKNQ